MIVWASRFPRLRNCHSMLFGLLQSMGHAAGTFGAVTTRSTLSSSSRCTCTTWWSAHHSLFPTSHLLRAGASCLRPSKRRSGMTRLSLSCSLRPNNSFKPNLLRYGKSVAEKACHAFASTTQVGLTQALGACLTMIELWAPISASDWHNVPCVAGRAATEADVAAGRAVYYIQGASSPAPFELPCCAYQLLANGIEQAVVIVQAENSPNGVLLGVRPLSGGNCICLASEVRLVPSGFLPESVA
jgi:hypothetical protein